MTDNVYCLVLKIIEKDERIIAAVQFEIKLFDYLRTWNVDFSSPSPDPLDLRRPAHVGVKEGTPVKSGYLYSVGLSSV